MPLTKESNLDSQTVGNGWSASHVSSHFISLFKNMSKQMIIEQMLIHFLVARGKIMYLLIRCSQLRFKVGYMPLLDIYLLYVRRGSCLT